MPQLLINQPGKNVVSIDAGGYRERFLARRDQLVHDHLELAASIARGIHQQLPPSFDLDDLVQTANLALIKAATQYRPKEHGNAPFAAYARQVIRGAVLDSARRKHYDEATRPPLSAAAEPVDAASIENVIDIGRRRQALARAVDQLDPREAKVIAMYYEGSEGSRSERITFVEIATEMGIHRDTVRKLYQSGLLKLRMRSAVIRREAA